MSLKKIVSSPITIKENHTLIPTQITDLKEGLRIGAYGIREPNEKSPTIDIKALDVVIVPAVAYDIHCYRLGYGGGFYDRFLENLRKRCYNYWHSIWLPDIRFYSKRNSWCTIRLHSYWN